MNDLPNGFTGFAGKRDDFESAADAMRKSRGETPTPSHVNKPAPTQSSAPDGAFQYARDTTSGRRVQDELPFELDELEETETLEKVNLLTSHERRWAWVEIDKAALRHNVADVRRHIPSRTRLMAVVKADAFGHGAVESAKVMLNAGVNRLAVANIDEAMALREAGIDAPILVLSQPPAAVIPLLLVYNATPTVYTPEFAIAYGEAADLRGMKAPYHLAINTGMNRIGVRYDEAVEFLYQVSFHRALELEGAFTHYATAEDADPFELQIQTSRFIDALQAMRAAGFEPSLVHVANSAATYRYPQVQFDMVRCASALYGFHSCPEMHELADLRPVMSVHARIVDARFVPMSEGVSFGLRYRSPGSVKICTVPIGYADGLSLGLSGNTDFIMKGRYFRQVGDICADQCMFEADMRSYGTRERIDPQVGDEVLVVGSQGIAQVTIDDMAEKLGVMPGEVSIGFARSLERVYV